MSAYNVRLYDYKHSQQIRIYTKTVNCKDKEKEIKADSKKNDIKDSKENEQKD